MLNPFSALTSKLFAGTSAVLLVLLGVSHCSDKRHTAQRDKARAELDMARRASADNLAAQQAQVAAIEAKYDDLAKESAHDLQIAQNDARTALDRYVTANRVRKDGLCRSPASAPSKREDPGVPPEMPADPDLVAVPRNDLQALADWLALGVTLRNKEASKVEKGLAEVVADDGLPGPKPEFANPPK